LHKILAIPVLLYGCETWSLKKRDLNRMKTAAIKYLSNVKGCTKVNQLKNEDIRNKLDIPFM
jgi:hypothetical protein